MYGIWCILTEGWVGEYAPDRVAWIPATYPSARAAKEDLYDWTTHTGGRKNYDVRVYRSKVQGDGSVPRSSSEAIDNGKRNNHTSVHGHADKGDEGTHDMSFKVKCKKNEDGDGSYNLAYGKGKKKVTGRLYKSDEWGWFIQVQDASWNSGSTFSKKRDAIVAWGTWAAGEYDKAPVSAAAITTPVAKGPPKLGKNRQKDSGPPLFKRSSAPASALNRPAHPDYHADQTDVIDNNENPYHADPLHEMFFAMHATSDTKVLLPVGALDEVFNWMQKNLPFTATLEYPWVRVTKVLQREFPDEAKYQSIGA